MDTTGKYPAIRNTDPLYEIADYTAQMRTALDAQYRFAEFNNGGFAVAGGSVAWDIGPLSLSTARSLNYGFTRQGGFSGSIDILETGWYNLSSIHAPGGPPGNAMVTVKINGTAIASGSTTGYVWEIATSASAVYIGAGANIRFSTNSTAAQTYRSTVRLQKLY